MFRFIIHMSSVLHRRWRPAEIAARVNPYEGEENEDLGRRDGGGVNYPDAVNYDSDRNDLLWDVRESNEAIFMNDVSGGISEQILWALPFYRRGFQESVTSVTDIQDVSSSSVYPVWQLAEVKTFLIGAQEMFYADNVFQRHLQLYQTLSEAEPTTFQEVRTVVEVVPIVASSEPMTVVQPGTVIDLGPGGSSVSGETVEVVAVANPRGKRGEGSKREKERLASNLARYEEAIKHETRIRGNFPERHPDIDAAVYARERASYEAWRDQSTVVRKSAARQVSRTTSSFSQYYAKYPEFARDYLKEVQPDTALLASVSRVPSGSMGYIDVYCELLRNQQTLDALQASLLADMHLFHERIGVRVVAFSRQGEEVRKYRHAPYIYLYGSESRGVVPAFDAARMAFEYFEAGALEVSHLRHGKQFARAFLSDFTERLQVMLDRERKLGYDNVVETRLASLIPGSRNLLTFRTSVRFPLDMDFFEAFFWLPTALEQPSGESSTSLARVKLWNGMKQFLRYFDLELIPRSDNDPVRFPVNDEDSKSGISVKMEEGRRFGCLFVFCRVRLRNRSMRELYRYMEDVATYRYHVQGFREYPKLIDWFLLSFDTLLRAHPDEAVEEDPAYHFNDFYPPPVPPEIPLNENLVSAYVRLAGRFLLPQLTDPEIAMFNTFTAKEQLKPGSLTKEEMKKLDSLRGKQAKGLNKEDTDALYDLRAAFQSQQIDIFVPSMFNGAKFPVKVLTGLPRYETDRYTGLHEYFEHVMIYLGTGNVSSRKPGAILNLIGLIDHSILLYFAEDRRVEGLFTFPVYLPDTSHVVSNVTLLVRKAMVDFANDPKSLLQHLYQRSYVFDNVFPAHVLQRDLPYITCVPMEVIAPKIREVFYQLAELQGIIARSFDRLTKTKGSANLVEMPYWAQVLVASKFHEAEAEWRRVLCSPYISNWFLELSLAGAMHWCQELLAYMEGSIVFLRLVHMQYDTKLDRTVCEKMESHSPTYVRMLANYNQFLELARSRPIGVLPADFLKGTSGHRWNYRAPFASYNHEFHALERYRKRLLELYENQRVGSYYNLPKDVYTRQVGETLRRMWDARDGMRRATESIGTDGVQLSLCVNQAMADAAVYMMYFEPGQTHLIRDFTNVTVKFLYPSWSADNEAAINARVHHIVNQYYHNMSTMSVSEMEEYILGSERIDRLKDIDRSLSRNVMERASFLFFQTDMVGRGDTPAARAADRAVKVAKMGIYKAFFGVYSGFVRDNRKIPKLAVFRSLIRDYDLQVRIPGNLPTIMQEFVDIVDWSQLYRWHLPYDPYEGPSNIPARIAAGLLVDNKEFLDFQTDMILLSARDHYLHRRKMGQLILDGMIDRMEGESELAYHRRSTRETEHRVFVQKDIRSIDDALRYRELQRIVGRVPPARRGREEVGAAFEMRKMLHDFNEDAKRQKREDEKIQRDEERVSRLRKDQRVRERLEREQMEDIAKSFEELEEFNRGEEKSKRVKR